MDRASPTAAFDPKPTSRSDGIFRDFVPAEGRFVEGGIASPRTREGGWCNVWIQDIPKKISSVTFTVEAVSHGDLAYVAGDNHDPDGDSGVNGDTITVSR